MIGIYKITNTLNNKCYIGQSINIEVRWKQHIYLSKNYFKYKPTNNLYLDMNKNLSSFYFEVIEKCSTNKLDDREKYWINYYNSYNNGYNKTIGGSGKRIYKINIDLLYNLWNEKYTIKEIADFFNCGIDTIRNYLKDYKNYSKEESYKRSAEKRTYLNITNNEIYYYTNNFYCLSVFQYTLSGIFIKQYSSFSQAAKQLQVKSASNIRAAATGYRSQKTAYGYRWSLVNLESLQPLEKIKNTRKNLKKVKCIETNEVFNSTGEAAKWCNLKSASSIRDCCTGRFIHAGRHPITKEKLSWIYI